MKEFFIHNWFKIIMIFTGFLVFGTLFYYLTVYLPDKEEARLTWEKDKVLMEQEEKEQQQNAYEQCKKECSEIHNVDTLQRGVDSLYEWTGPTTRRCKVEAGRCIAATEALDEAVKKRTNCYETVCINKYK